VLVRHSNTMAYICMLDNTALHLGSAVVQVEVLRSTVTVRVCTSHAYSAPLRAPQRARQVHASW
jgi:hypothetical protein